MDKTEKLGTDVMLKYRLRQIMRHVNEAEKAGNLPGARAEAIQELCDEIAKDYAIGIGWTCGGIEVPNERKSRAAEMES